MYNARIEKAPNTLKGKEVQAVSIEGNSKNGENKKEQIQKGDNKHEACSSSSSSVPTDIKNIPGLQLVVDLNAYNELKTTSNLAANTTKYLKNAYAPINDIEVNDIEESDNDQYTGKHEIEKRGRSETRKGGRRHRQKTHPS